MEKNKKQIGNIVLLLEHHHINGGINDIAHGAQIIVIEHDGLEHLL